MTMHVLYYITSHGFGHAVRSAAVINKLFETARACGVHIRVTIKSGVPKIFFDEELSDDHNVINAEFDCGCLQRDAVSVNIEDTLAMYDKIARRNKLLLDDEVQWCLTNKVDRIVSDIVPFAFEVAARAGVPSFAVSNFTWYDIYAPYVGNNPRDNDLHDNDPRDNNLHSNIMLDKSTLPRYRSMLDEMKRQYQTATKVLALDPALPMNVFDGCDKTIIPVVGKRGINRKQEIFDRFGIAPNKRLGLIYVGNFGLDDVDWRRLDNIDGWEFAGVYPLSINSSTQSSSQTTTSQTTTSARSSTMITPPKNFHHVTKDQFAYQDLSASADAVVCKLGYGVFAESRLNGVPLIYLPRKNFIEFEYLDAEVKRLNCGVCISRDKFFDVSWQDVLYDVTNVTKKLTPTDAVGAEICAKQILATSGA